MAWAMAHPVAHSMAYPNLTSFFFLFLSEPLVHLVYLVYCGGEFGTIIVCYRKIGTVYYKHTFS